MYSSNYKIMTLRIRPEEPRDYEIVYEINRQAFDSSDEAEIVKKVRHHSGPIISLVAEIDSQIVGHIMFSPVNIIGDQDEWKAMGLGPVAILPTYQRKGIGTALIYAGLESCRQIDQSIVFLVGHPDYYPRFGFKLARKQGFQYKSARFDPYFFVLELRPGALTGKSGYVQFLPAFGVE
jgi:putative acetyltransferase